MILRRLTKTQKNQILEGYRKGESANELSVRFNCSSNTINRTVKTLISDEEYELLKGKRLRLNKNKGEKFSTEIIDQQEENSRSLLNELKIPIDNQCSKNVEEFDNDKINEVYDDNFEEIAPLESDFDFDIEKRKIDLILLDNKALPESVYMIVDKKVELDDQPISSLPEWSFLPEDELKRHAILLFPNQRSAKRSCSRNQRVIKIPNTQVFQTTKSFLVSKGITRLILEDSLISLIN